MDLHLQTQRIGVIPFDTLNNDIAVLFVTSQTRGRWILPKGKPHAEENHTDTCKREAFQEAGVRGTVIEDFPITAVITRQTLDGKKKMPVTYYPMLVSEQVSDWPEKNKRQRHWALLRDAPKVAYKEDLLSVTQQFETLALWIIDIAALYKDKQQVKQTLVR